jgi:formylglycine-generating enzyme required for sulfatase activity/serine/threonine protein phosphatase PrpC
LELVFEIAGDQIDGARDYQEDAFLITFLDDDDGGRGKSSALVIMADGMGGHAAGNIASNLVVSTFNKAFTGGFSRVDVPNLLRKCLARSNSALAESIKETPALDGMGCTMVTAMFTKGKAYWVSVGDSHFYLIRDRELLKKNEDHSYGGYLDRMKAQGMDVEPEAGLSRNMLMSAMTGEDITEVDCPDDPLQLLPGDRIVVCSDGLDTLSAGMIIQTSAWSPSVKECVAALLKAVEDANKPRQDNTTVVVIDVLEGESAPLPARAAPAAVPEPAPEPEIAAAPTRAGDTQELTATEIQDALAARGKEGGPGGLLKVLVVLILLGALGAAAWYFLLGPGASSPQNGEGVATAPATAPPERPAAGESTATGGAQTGESAETEAESTTEQEETVPESGSEPAETSTQPTSVPEVVVAQPVELRDPLSSGGEGPLMVRIPAGTFMMGAKAFGGESDELPRHERRIDAFAMSKFEVTIGEYRRFATATNRRMPSLSGPEEEQLPMVLVSWEDAVAYANWLSQQTGQRYRLPTEAQWEYAARGGTESTYWWGVDLGSENAHCFDCKTGLNPRLPTRVGRFAANPFGLHDTAGNVMEWTRDCYHNTYKAAPADDSVWEGGDCSVRVVRGGAYGSVGTSSLRSANRDRRDPNTGTDDVGIRLVRDP